MDKKAITEVKKLFNKNNCRVDRMRGVLVDENKERTTTLKETFLALEDEEMFKYCEIFRKGLSGRIGRNLFNVEFPLAEEKEGGHQAFLYRLLESELKDDALTEEFFEKVIASYQFPGKYLVLLIHGVYDIPSKTTDGLTMDDASEYVYSFIQVSICPVSLLRDGLCYDSEHQSFRSRAEDWAVQKPEVSFLFPAFNDRNTDLHASLYYAKNPAERHDELAEELLGTELPRPEAAEKDVFRSVIEETLGRDCDFEIVRSINEEVTKLVEDRKDDPVPPVLEKNDIRRLLANNGAKEEALEKFDTVYEEIAGSNPAPLMAENVAERKKLQVKTDNLKLDVNTEATELIETRVIDGVEYFLIPVADNVSVNGIKICAKVRETEE